MNIFFMEHRYIHILKYLLFENITANRFPLINELTYLLFSERKLYNSKTGPTYYSRGQCLTSITINPVKTTRKLLNCIYLFIFLFHVFNLNTKTIACTVTELLGQYQNLCVQDKGHI